jgi:hypothetical protein
MINKNSASSAPPRFIIGDLQNYSGNLLSEFAGNRFRFNALVFNRVI